MRAILSTIILLSTFFSGEQNMDKRAEQKRRVKTFSKNFQDYKINIEAAGIATITDASFIMEGELWVSYAYISENESRKGKMRLLVTDNQNLEGEWKTEADNGNSYNGTLYFKFEENGEANGHYTFGGTDYKITILKK